MKSNSFLPIRTALACSNLWKLEAEEKDLLNRFFILWDDGEHLFKDLKKRNDPQYPYQSEYFLTLGEGDNAIWNVRFLKPISYLRKLGNQKIALSFREHKPSGFNWVIVTEWKEKELDKTEEIQIGEHSIG